MLKSLKPIHASCLPFRGNPPTLGFPLLVSQLPPPILRSIHLKSKDLDADKRKKPEIPQFRKLVSIVRSNLVSERKSSLEPDSVEIKDEEGGH